MKDWTRVLRQNEQRKVVEGSAAQLAAAVGRGADLRGYTTFDYQEHMCKPPDDGLVQEMMSFATVYLLDQAHVAGIQTVRYPANASLDFGEPPSLSFFLYNVVGGEQGVARFYLDGRVGPEQSSDVSTDRYHVKDTWDEGTSCPSSNFTYDFGEYGWWVNASWQEILAHDENGVARRGSLERLQESFRAGADLKVGVTGLCDYLAPAPPSAGADAVAHEIFVTLHSVYNHEDAGFLGGESMPMVRVAPTMPMRYQTDRWDYGWILPRTDGIVHKLIMNPYTREVRQEAGRFAVRWFVR